jgi:adenosylhomocysteine nucleosidase
MATGNFVLILTALTQELDATLLPDHVKIVFTGAGKINAAHVTTLELLANRPSVVLNYGTAGRIHQEISGLVEVASVVQRDMMTSPLAPRGVVPYDDQAHTLHSGQSGVRCGTGDSFVTSHDEWFVEKNVDLVDMELFAIAAVCDRMGVPWRSFKYISDDANHASSNAWEENVHRGQGLFLERLRTL